MNPVLQTPKTSWEYTVIGTFQATNERPLLANADRPPAMAAKYWKTLVERVYAHRYLSVKCLRLAIHLVLLSIFILSYSIFQTYAEDQVVDGVKWILLGYFLLAFFLQFALEGLWLAPTVEFEVSSLQSSFRDAGYEVSFRKEGRWFFVVGILTISRSTYTAPNTELQSTPAVNSAMGGESSNGIDVSDGCVV
jgi:hypothetical protein